MVINYKVSPTFARFHACKTRYKFVMGPVGSGKSSGCMWDLFFNAAEQTPDENGVRHSRYAVIRATYPQLKSSTVKTFIEWFKDKITVTYGNPITARLNMDLDDGTRVNTEFMFVAVGDEVDAEKLRSWEFTGAWVNPAARLYLLRRRVRTDCAAGLPDPAGCVHGGGGAQCRRPEDDRVCQRVRQAARACDSLRFLNFLIAT